MSMLKVVQKSSLSFSATFGELDLDIIFRFDSCQRPCRKEGDSHYIELATGTVAFSSPGRIVHPIDATLTWEDTPRPF